MNLFGRKSSPAAVKTVAAPDSVAETTPVDSAAVPPPAVDAPVVDAAPPAAPEPEKPTDAAIAANTAARLAFLDKGTAAMTSTPPKPPAASFLSGAPRADQPPRRVLDMPGGLGGRRPEPTPVPAAPQPEAAVLSTAEPQRRLTVGRDISLAGEIASCDVLVVEGTVEAKLRDGHSIEVTETGLFKGSVEIDDADIGGRFEGDIVVRNRLRVRSSGRIIGSIVYGELEVETGGRLVGSIKIYDPQPKAEVAVSAEAPAPAPVFVPAPAAVEASGSDVQPAQVYVPPTQTFGG